MAVKTIEEIEKLLKDYSDFVLGKCNCPTHRRERARLNLNTILKEVYPELGFLPFNYDSDAGYGNKSKSLTKLKAGDRPKYIFKKLKKLRSDNSKLADVYAKMGVKYTFCRDCGVLIKETQSTMVTSDHPRERLTISFKPKHDKKTPVCTECKEYYFECGECGGWYDKKRGNSAIMKEGALLKYHNSTKLNADDFSLLCRSCFTNLPACIQCGVRAHKKLMIDVSDISYHTVRARVVPTVDGPRHEQHPTVMCVACHKTQITKCPTCGDTCIRNEMRRWEVDDGDVVLECRKCHEKRIPVKSHDYRPSRFTKLVSKRECTSIPENILLYGFEIEVENLGRMGSDGNWHPYFKRATIAQKAMDFFGDDECYCVHDGTLRISPEGAGLEIVTQPRSWQKYKEQRDKFTDLLIKLREWGGQAYRPGTAGFHAHMSKAAFTRLHLYKFIDFLYKKSTKDFRTAIAQRGGNDYSRFSSEDANNTKKIAKDKYNVSGSHYSAVNLTNPDTVEVRIFRGTLEPLWFHKNIEFLHSLYRFSRDNRLQDMIVYKYIAYILQNKNEYRCLLEFIKDNVDINRRYISVRRLLKGVK
jgi:hypothetical protein